MLVVVAAAVVVALLVVKGDKKLSHTAVENYIQDTKHLGTNVKCNNGKDFTMKKNGDSFTCTADGGKSFTVTIKDKSNGSYVVQ